MDCEEEIARSNNVISQEIYKILSKQAGNVFFSPLSIHLTLTILQLGSKEPTHELMKLILKTPNTDSIINGYKTTIKRLNSLKHIKFIMANKIYLTEKDSKISPNYEALLKNFDAEIELLNCDNPQEAARNVNDWVEKKTTFLKNLVSEALFKEHLSLILINAIYFKGEWVSKFREVSTKEDDFTLGNGELIKVQMMHQKGSFWFRDDEDLEAKIIELPYKGFDVKMMIILPNDNDLEKLEKKMIGSDLNRLENGLKLTEIDLFLPKFKMEKNIKLNDVLSDLGLRDIFDNSKANFEGILQSDANNLFVSEIIQKAFIEVNEGGTVAAAATRVALALGCVRGAPKPQIFKVDHPAIFLLLATQKEKDFVNILFYGRLAYPQFE